LTATRVDDPAHPRADILRLKFESGEVPIEVVPRLDDVLSSDLSFVSRVLGATDAVFVFENELVRRGWLLGAVVGRPAAAGCQAVERLGERVDEPFSLFGALAGLGEVPSEGVDLMVGVGEERGEFRVGGRGTVDGLCEMAGWRRRGHSEISQNENPTFFSHIMSLSSASVCSPARRVGHRITASGDRHETRRRRKPNICIYILTSLVCRRSKRGRA
jgi:hypothetical protein